MSTHTPPDTPIEQLMGIGPKSAQWLRDVGIATQGDLKTAGVIEAYRRVCAQQEMANLNLLWALQGALQDIHWTQVSPQERKALKEQLDEIDAS